MGETEGFCEEIAFYIVRANDRMVGMTSDERAQLIEDIDRSANIRSGIVGQARLSKDFDIAAAWQDLEELDRSINERVVKARSGR